MLPCERVVSAMFKAGIVAGALRCVKSGAQFAPGDGRGASPTNLAASRYQSATEPSLCQRRGVSQLPS